LGVVWLLPKSKHMSHPKGQILTRIPFWSYD